MDALSLFRFPAFPSPGLRPRHSFPPCRAAAARFYRSPPRIFLVRAVVSAGPPAGASKWPFRFSWSKSPAEALVEKSPERVVEESESEAEAETGSRSWASSLLRGGYLWLGKNKVDNGGDGLPGGGGSDLKDGFWEDWDGGEVEKFDGSTFPTFLKRVSLEEAQLYAKMSYLGNLAYYISSIKPGSLVLKYHRLNFVTSSLRKRESRGMNVDEHLKSDSSRKAKKQLEQIIDGKKANMAASDMDAFMANSSSVTVMVAAEEGTKQEVAKDLNSVYSSTCEWFVCDEKHTRTRLFVIQGSDSLASWQANLLFEPVQFEGLDVLVHRGVYEAAKGIYEQMLPEVQEQLKLHSNAARLRFTGHSLGGSLALLVSLMLLIRGEAPRSCLLPVITFGSPSILYGGDKLLMKLGLPRSHVQAITMHRDVVPRAFSCNYPDHVAAILKVVNKNFRNHPCLKYQKTLYTPTGELLILQPDNKHSPEHHFLPPGTGLYRLCGGLDSVSAVITAAHNLRVAVMAFLNSPHPLDTLRTKSAYGYEGTIYKNHDMSSYARAVRYVMRQELIRLKEERKHFWWPLVVAASQFRALVALVYALHPASRATVFFVGLLQMGENSFRHISRSVASLHLSSVLLLIPLRFLLFKLVRVIY